MLRRIAVVALIISPVIAGCSSESSSNVADACSVLDVREIDAVTGDHITRTRPEQVDIGSTCVWSNADGGAVALTIGGSGSASELAEIISDSTAHLGASTDINVIGSSRAVEYAESGVVVMSIGGRAVIVQQMGFMDSGALHEQLADAVARGLR